MKRVAGIALGVVFAAAVGGVGYESYQLNNLVWSAPDKGETEIWRSGDVIDYTLELDRKNDLLHREEFTVKLNAMFEENAAEPFQVCVDTGYEISGIFKIDPANEYIAKYIKANPVFENFVNEQMAEYAAEDKVEFNNWISFYTHNDCEDYVREAFADELAAIIDVRKAQLGIK